MARAKVVLRGSKSHTIETATSVQKFEEGRPRDITDPSVIEFCRGHSSFSVIDVAEAKPQPKAAEPSESSEQAEVEGTPEEEDDERPTPARKKARRRKVKVDDD